MSIFVIAHPRPCGNRRKLKNAKQDRYVFTSNLMPCRESNPGLLFRHAAGTYDVKKLAIASKRIQFYLHSYIPMYVCTSVGETHCFDTTHRSHLHLEGCSMPFFGTLSRCHTNKSVGLTMYPAAKVTTHV
jgi:hypothetical protein